MDGSVAVLDCRVPSLLAETGGLQWDCRVASLLAETGWGAYFWDFHVASLIAEARAREDE
jgi:hypothetical protein